MKEVKLKDVEKGDLIYAHGKYYEVIGNSEKMTPFGMGFCKLCKCYMSHTTPPGEVDIGRRCYISTNATVWLMHKAKQ